MHIMIARIPIVFAFDNNLTFPACICISSLLMNAKETTFYDIFILHSKQERLDRLGLDKLEEFYKNCKITYRTVDSFFDKSFEIRGITTPAYYRLLIPDLIPEYGKVIYSDVDVIFRSDLSDIYYGTDLSDYYIAGVNSLAHLVPKYKNYFINQRHLDPTRIIYSGNLIFNSQKMREDNLISRFRELAMNKYMFQDMDILNIVCGGKICYLTPDFCLSTFVSEAMVYQREALLQLWSQEEIETAFQTGIVHYNGQKPWKGFCVNFDIWWEYYRRSPFFDEKFYFDFFYNKLNELDQLSLWKRIKILIRYFVYGRKSL